VSGPRARRDLRWLFARSGGGVKLGLERVRALLEALGSPHLDTPALVIGGSNGKGSVASLCAAALSAGGKRVGLFTSPHIRDFGERVRIDGLPLPEAEVERFLERAGPLIEGCDATFFEATTALAFETFRDRRVDVAVLEVGLGGRLDATNVTEPLAAAVTSIDLEHTGILGDDLRQIASEKYPIARPGRPLVVGPVVSEVGDWFRDRARAEGVELMLLDEHWSWGVRAHRPAGLSVDLRGPIGEIDELGIALRGRHQAANAALACALLERAGLWPGERAIRRGFGSLSLRGRFDIVRAAPPPVVVDVAHNPAGITVCAATWRELFGPGGAAVVFSALRDKDLDAIFAALAPIAARIFVPALDARRARPPELVAAEARRAGADTRECASVGDALQRALDFAARGGARGVLCAGSFHVAEAAYRLLPEERERGTDILGRTHYAPS